MRKPLRFAAALLAVGLVLSVAEPGSAQRRRSKKSATAATTAPPKKAKPEARPESVVMLPENARPKMDTALINPQPTPKRRRRFEVKVVPATAPGRSRQEVMYSDSLLQRTRR